MQPTDLQSDQLDQDYIQILITSLKNGSIDKKQAEAQTSEYLALAPYSTVDEMKEKIKKFVDKYQHFSPIYINLLKTNDEKMKDVLLRVKSFI